MLKNPSPVYKQGSKWKRSPVEFKIDYDKIRWLTQQRELEWQEVNNYIKHEGCLMRYLQTSLDDSNQIDCGKCQNCIGTYLFSPEIDVDKGKEAASFVKKTDLPLKLKVRITGDALENYGWRGNLPRRLRGNEGKILSRWKDAGWGKYSSKE